MSLFSLFHIFFIFCPFKSDKLWNEREEYFYLLILNPIHDGLVMGGGPFLAPFPKIRHTHPTMMKPYLRKIQKIHKSRDTSFEFCWYQHFFTGNQQILLHREIHILIGFWYKISNSFDFSWVFSNCFNKHGYNFDNVSKNNFSRPS